ncbi:MAG: hypothetical protein EBQ95_01085 [Gammaproteobacteria bacterium]|nr:hypothetical protein [Gammaproteobacteria bacterium]
MAFNHHHWWLITGLCILIHSVYAETQTDVYGKRYCEIVSTNDFSNFTIYNSDNVNDCPHHWWSSLNEIKLKRYLKASFVHMQGPNTWMVDKIIYPNSYGLRKNIMGKQFQQVGHFKMEWNKLIKNHGPYIEYTITKKHLYEIHQGRQIYELKDAAGNYYVLYGLSMDMKDIQQLKNQLKLPRGWQFLKGKLAKDYILNSANSTIYIVQDNLNNNYQRVEKDLLEQ